MPDVRPLEENMKPGLEISIVWFDAHLIELRVGASNGTFAGRTQLYENHDVLASFVSALQGFPGSASDCRDIVLGNFDPKHAGGGVRLRFRCKDAAGHASVDITMRADPQRAGEEMAAFSVPLEASAIDTFVKRLATMPLKDSSCAMLEAAV